MWDYKLGFMSDLKPKFLLKNRERCKPIKKMVAYYFKKMRFLILRTLNEFLKQIFIRNILRKVFYFKGKDIIHKQTIRRDQIQATQNKTKSQSKIFSVINKTNKCEGRGQSS